MNRTVIILLATLCFGRQAFGYECSTDDSNEYRKLKFILLPLLINSPETKFGGGAVGGLLFKTDPDSLVRTSNLSLGFLYTLGKQMLLQSGGTVYFRQENYILRYLSTYSYFPDKFWGIGNDTPDHNKEVYIYKQFYLNVQFTRRIHRRWFLGINYDHQRLIDIDYKPNGIFEKSDIYGRQGGLSSGIGPILYWDSRNNAFSPSKGEFFQFTLLSYHSLLKSDFNYASYIFDFRKYMRSFRKNVFAFQVYGQLTSGNVPFRVLPGLGGPYLMRGYYMGRYKDKSLMACQAEYRVPLKGRLGAVGFAGLGDVSSSFNSYSLSSIKYSCGAGLRIAILPKEKLNLRVDAAMARGSTGIYVYIMEAF